MITFDIRSKEFNGLMLTIHADRDGLHDAEFASSGNRIPEKMYRRLVNNWCDERQIWMEIDNAKYEGEL